MSNSTIGKSGVRSSFKFSDVRIRTKLLAIISDLKTYKKGLLALNAVMVELKKRIFDVEHAKRQATDILEKFDRDVVQAINAANTKVLRTLRIAEASLITISLVLIVALIVLTTLFFKSIIKKTHGRYPRWHQGISSRQS